jgi:hypothetical protein
MIHYRVHKSLAWIKFLSHINPIHDVSPFQGNIERHSMLYGPCIILQCMYGPTDAQHTYITEFIHESMRSTMFRTSRVHPQERTELFVGVW